LDNQAAANRPRIGLPFLPLRSSAGTTKFGVLERLWAAVINNVERRTSPCASIYFRDRKYFSRTRHARHAQRP
jgi:hypothetical protein